MWTSSSSSSSVLTPAPPSTLSCFCVSSFSSAWWILGEICPVIGEMNLPLVGVWLQEADVFLPVIWSPAVFPDGDRESDSRMQSRMLGGRAAVQSQHSWSFQRIKHLPTFSLLYWCNKESVYCVFMCTCWVKVTEAGFMADEDAQELGLPAWAGTFLQDNRDVSEPWQCLKTNKIFGFFARASLHKYRVLILVLKSISRTSNTR